MGELRSKGGAMKMLVVCFILGVIALYFLNIALLKAAVLDLEWSIHAAIRFFAGFILLGISYFYAHALKLKNALYLIACIVAIDYVYDYYAQNYHFKFEIMLHGIFMIIWGAFLGYFTAKYIRDQSDKNLNS